MSVEMEMTCEELFRKHCSSDVMTQEEQDNMFEEVREMLDADIIKKLRAAGIVEYLINKGIKL
jgi:hypothetical protein